MDGDGARLSARSEAGKPPTQTPPVEAARGRRRVVFLSRTGGSKISPHRPLIMHSLVPRKTAKPRDFGICYVGGGVWAR